MAMLDYETALKAVRAGVAEINDSRAPDAQVSLDEDATLFGEDSPLDSLSLVQVVMAAEGYLSEMAGIDLVLASEAAMSRKRSPYRSLRNLAEYAVEMSEAEVTQ